MSSFISNLHYNCLHFKEMYYILITIICISFCKKNCVVLFFFTSVISNYAMHFCLQILNFFEKNWLFKVIMDYFVT